MSQVSIYVQGTDPGAVGACIPWINSTTGDFNVRNITNVQWTTIFNIGVANGGLLPLSGGSMTGGITGAHGLLPSDSPAATTNATLDGNDLATKAFVINELAGYQPLA